MRGGMTCPYLLTGTLTLVCVAAATLAPGCSARAARRPPATTVPAVASPSTRPSAGTTTFARPKLGIELAYPAGWEARASADYELLLRPARSGDGSDDDSISLDVPQLPFHLPGLIPIGAVRSGYLDDLRKQAGPLTTEDLPAPDVGGATVRLVRSRWGGPAGGGLEETALLMVHGDRVYIVRARAAGGRVEETRGAFDAVVRSVRWIKPDAK